MKFTVSEEDFLMKKPLAIFLSYYKPNMRLFLLDMICAFFISGIDLSFPMLSRFALNTYLPENNFRAFFLLIAIIFVSFAVKAGMQYIVTYWGHIMGADIEMQMRRDLFGHLQNLSFTFYDKSRTGNLMSRILSDLFDITELSHHGPEDLFISSVTLIGSVIALFFINVKLTIILLIFLPLLLLFTILLRKRMSFASARLKDNTASLNSQIESSISGSRVSKAFANESYEAGKFEHVTLDYRNARGRFYKIMSTFFTGMEFMIGLLNLLAIGFGGYLIMKGELNVIDLITFTLYISLFLSPIRKLINFTELYQSGMSGFLRFVSLMREKPDITNRKDAIVLSNVKGEVSFSNVTFSYSSDETADKVLSNINLVIDAGKTAAIVGPSGSGKTTLCHLIPRFYEVQEGAIRLDGIDIRDIDISSLRKNIGIVQQDVYLFAASIMENIRYGRLDATDEEVLSAAKEAELDEFVKSLPDGYSTYVGERGLLLSGGQKQRISIARVFLKNPPVLLLDEATSALDTQTELRIQEALERLSKGRTCLIVAHRLSTIRNADEIIYLDENGVQERGSHEVLLAANGLYAELYKVQFSGKENS